MAKHMLYLLVLTGFGVLNLTFCIERCLHVGLESKEVTRVQCKWKSYYTY